MSIYVWFQRKNKKLDSTSDYIAQAEAVVKRARSLAVKRKIKFPKRVGCIGLGREAYFSYNTNSTRDLLVEALRAAKVAIISVRW